MKSRQRIRLVVLVLWLGCLMAGFSAQVWIAPTGDGFHRGLNRAGYSLLFHALAVVLALLLAVMANRAPHINTKTRRVYLVPFGVELLFLGYVLIAIAYR